MVLLVYADGHSCCRCHHAVRSKATYPSSLGVLSETVPEMVDVIANASMRLALGGAGTGSSWHNHGPAMLAVAAGSKAWYIRDPARTLPPWLQLTLDQSTGLSTKVRRHRLHRSCIALASLLHRSKLNLMIIEVSFNAKAHGAGCVLSLAVPS